MQERILGWNIRQVAELVGMVNHNQGKNLLNVFEDFGNKCGRKKYSVRNFYYGLIQEAESNAQVREILAKNNINLGYTSHFCEEDERECLLAILTDNGKSVRATCFELANGDKVRATRYQNKYRNSLKNKPDLIKNLAEEITKSGQKCRVDFGSNIIKLPSSVEEKNYITEDEIQSLFWGLVKLVKRSAEQELEDKQNYQMRVENSRLNEVLIDNKRKGVLIQELRTQNEALQSRLNFIEKEQRQNQANYQKINNLLRDNKMDRLREFMLKFNKTEQKTSKKR